METTPRPFRVLNLFAFCALCFNWCAQAQPPDAPAKHDHSAAATDANPEFAKALMSSMEKMDSDMRAAPMTNTVSVIDPSSNKLLGVIGLGDPVPGALSPLYRASCLCME